MVEQVDVRVPDGDSVRHVFQRTSSVFDRRLDFIGVDVIRRDGPGRWTVTGRRVRDSSFAWLVSEGAQRRGDTVPTPGEAVATGAALPLAILHARPPRVGDVRTVLMADPLQRRLVPVQVTVAGDSTAVVPDSAALGSGDPAVAPGTLGHAPYLADRRARRRAGRSTRGSTRMDFGRGRHRPRDPRGASAV
jgi:hypothetical protein